MPVSFPHVRWRQMPLLIGTAQQFSEESGEESVNIVYLLRRRLLKAEARLWSLTFGLPLFIWRTPMDSRRGHPLGQMNAGHHELGIHHNALLSCPYAVNVVMYSQFPVSAILSSSCTTPSAWLGAAGFTGFARAAEASFVNPK